ncbi:hypothetical protein CP969_07220 [Streptomyces viridosporus T7A]|uniref:Uncharacterized protein n=1 Tax=Streptomyces viridosporus T7A TaxID=665577 RepID=A0ABX6A9R7_STRVD|nr:hypothetical protein CP969_07220 [Streptomyces viridosporus T7A]
MCFPAASRRGRAATARRRPVRARCARRRTVPGRRPPRRPLRPRTKVWPNHAHRRPDESTAGRRSFASPFSPPRAGTRAVPSPLPPAVSPGHFTLLKEIARSRGPGEG